MFFVSMSVCLCLCLFLFLSLTCLTMENRILCVTPSITSCASSGLAHDSQYVSFDRSLVCVRMYSVCDD